MKTILSHISVSLIMIRVFIVIMIVNRCLVNDESQHDVTYMWATSYGRTIQLATPLLI